MEGVILSYKGLTRGLTRVILSYKGSTGLVPVDSTVNELRDIN